MRQQSSVTRADLLRHAQREVFLSEMDGLITWADLIEGIEPLYGAHTRGRVPIGPDGRDELHTTARDKFTSAHHRPTVVAPF
jgi:hypothetical protein